MTDRKTFGILRTLAIALALATAVFFSYSCAKKPVPPVPPPSEETVLPDEKPSGKPDGGEKPDDGETDEKPSWATNYTLPDAEKAYEKLTQIYGGEEKIFLLQKGKIARMPCPKDGAAMKLNFTYEVGDYAKIVIEDCVDEFNEVFEVINPNYRFETNYAPTDDDFDSRYSVRMRAADNLGSTESSTVFGTAHISYYDNFTVLGDFGINLKTEVLTNGSYLMTTLKHELMHLLGAGDAYNNVSATKATVMQSYTVGGYHHFSSTDVAFLDALYRNPDCEKSDDFIRSYIENYETATKHTRFENTKAVYAASVAALNGAVLKEQIEAAGYKDVAGLISLTENGLTADADFGKSDVAFTELPYAEPPQSTYFGAFDVGGKMYKHGTMTSLGSAFQIKYTDFGNGILYAEPNGNNFTIFVRTGEYVLLLRLHGGFTNLPQLSLTLWHACTVE